LDIASRYLTVGVVGVLREHCKNVK
jgi:hypothetical protein